MKFSAIRSAISSSLETVLVLAIRGYQKTRFFRPPSCRFYPTCSEYMAVSLTRFGAFRGSVLGLLRLAKCHPWNDGGVDMVPNEFELPISAQHSLHHRMQR